MANRFFVLTRRLLDQRYALLKQGITPKYTDIRHFFYECRFTFLNEHKELTEVDTHSKTPYVDWQNGALNYWCKTHCAEFDVPEEYYWRVREKLNIWAEPRAVCEGESGKFLIDKDARARVAQGCSLILLCEKKTVSAELLASLRELGYRVNLISTGGHSVSDVQEAVMQAVADLDGDNPTFYIIVLHDFDRDGVKIYFTLKERYDNVIDAGVNTELINYLKSLGNFDSRLVEEQQLNRNMQGELRDKIAEGNTAYSLDDFEYLQGVQVTGKKEWKAHRIEIDSIHVKYGIEPFIKYIVNKIQTECPQWDLTRIGINEYELDEPENPFHAILRDYNAEFDRCYREKFGKFEKSITTVNEFIKQVTAHFRKDFNVLSMTKKIIYSEADQAYKLFSPELDELTGKYGDGFERTYADDYDDELAELNEKVHCYEGDVTRAKEDLDERASGLQEDVNDYRNEDEEASAFSDELEKIDWGKDDFDKLPIPDEREVIRTVISQLQERLALLNNGHKTEGSR